LWEAAKINGYLWKSDPAFMDFALFFGAFTSLLSIVNPLNATPIFLSLTATDSPERRAQIARKAGIFMVLIMVSFFFAGTWILEFFGISIPGIRIAGGLMLANSAFSMLNPDLKGRKMANEDIDEAKEKPDISFSPLTMPLLSGPGTIATCITWAAEIKGATSYAAVIAAMLSVALTSYVVLRLAPLANKLIGKTGMGAVTRIMGFIVLCVAVQFVINGVLGLR
jgi:multiple antibiotic resistance protein